MKKKTSKLNDFISRTHSRSAYLCIRSEKTIDFASQAATGLGRNQSVTHTKDYTDTHNENKLNRRAKGRLISD